MCLTSVMIFNMRVCYKKRELLAENQRGGAFHSSCIYLVLKFLFLSLKKDQFVEKMEFEFINAIRADSF